MNITKLIFSGTMLRLYPLIFAYLFVSEHMHTHPNTVII